MNLASILFEPEAPYKNRPAFRYLGRDYSHDWAQGNAMRLAAGLVKRGIGTGSRVVLLARNKPEWMVAFFAVAATGATVVPLNPDLTAHETDRILENCDAHLAICDATLAPRFVDSTVPVFTFDADGGGTWLDLMNDDGHDGLPVSCDGHSPVAMFYTSGTTGNPKGVLLGHSAELFTAELVKDVFELSPEDRTLIPGSLSFIYPLVIDCLACMRAGATVVCQDRFHPEKALRAIEAERITVFMGVPTMFGMMLNWAGEKYVDASSLRLCVSAGQNLSWAVATQFRDRFGTPVLDLWGQTEGTPITSYIPRAEPEGRPESCGRALPGCDVRIVDDEGRDVPPNEVGEVIMTGPNLMLGYFRDPEATAETLRDGWVFTGDLGKLDEDGYLYIVGRKKDMIIRGGANIYPIEIEEVLYDHPAVAECAVVGIPDEKFGEVVWGFVVLKAGETADEKALREFAAYRLAEYKVPVRIEFRGELPKGPTGKILKRALRDGA